VTHEPEGDNVAQLSGGTPVVGLGDHIEAKILRLAHGRQLLGRVGNDFVQNDGATLRALNGRRSYGAARVGHDVFGHVEGVRAVADRATHDGCDGYLT
jgi:hypothetical protein